MATKRFLLLDDGGESADRYTLYDTKPVDGRINYIGFSRDPYHPQGVGQHGESSAGAFNRVVQELKRNGTSNIGKPIKLSELPEQAQKFAKSFMDDQLGEALGEYEGKMKSMSYGQMPSKAEFVERTEGQYPYPMELVGEDKHAMERAGLLDIDGVEEFYTGSHKFGIKVMNAEAMYAVLEALVERWGNEEDDDAGDLASGIMGTLGYEWV